MSEAIRIEGLTRRFGRVTALDGVSLHVQGGEFFALLGPDGAGKTTLCRILAGILDPTEGQAEVAGFDVVKQREPLKDVIGYMPQAFGLYPDLTVDENIEFYADLFGVPRQERRERKQRLLEMTYLSKFTRRHAGNLSGGMKQKLTLAVCLIHTPRVLILDEPTLGVDPVSRREFWKLLYDLISEGVLIFVATSYMDEAQRCHRVAVLDRGRVLACDPPDDVRARVRGRMLEVTPPDLDAAVTLARQCAGVVMATPFGETLHVLLEEGAVGEPVLRERFTGIGVPSDQIREVSPSLEDAFIYLVRTAGAPA